jgi:ATP-dependent RNA helicase DeaD
VSYDVPADEQTLVARHGGDAAAVVLVTPQELAHLRELARRAKLAARAMPVPVETTDFTRGIEAFRRQIARAVRERDLGAQMLVLGPLFDEFGAAEVAAAAAALLREKPPAPAAEAATPARGAQPAAAPTSA